MRAQRTGFGCHPGTGQLGTDHVGLAVPVLVDPDELVVRHLVHEGRIDRVLFGRHPDQKAAGARMAQRAAGRPDPARPRHRRTAIALLVGLVALVRPEADAGRGGDRRLPRGR
jgi:hypothetical protein